MVETYTLLLFFGAPHLAQLSQGKKGRALKVWRTERMASDNKSDRMKRGNGTVLGQNRLGQILKDAYEC